MICAREKSIINRLNTLKGGYGCLPSAAIELFQRKTSDGLLEVAKSMSYRTGKNGAAEFENE